MIFVLPLAQLYFALLISCVVSVVASTMLEFFFGLKTFRKMEESGEFGDFKLHNYVMIKCASFFISIFVFYFVSKFFGC